MHQQHGDNASTDSQFSLDDELSFLEACMDCDEDALYHLIQDGIPEAELNETDKSGRTALSHACANGFLPIVELLQTVRGLDPNLPDNDGNTPLIFAAQAGHAEVVSILLHMRGGIRIDQCNKLGFTALMKAAIQGRTKCAKLLLFAGGNPNRRDYGRGLCAEEWARFCGRINCADAIAKYIKSKKYFFKKTFMMTRERWNSEPDLKVRVDQALMKEQGNWIQRHLSFKKKKRGGSARGRGAGGRGGGGDTDMEGLNPSLGKESRTSSSPLLVCSSDNDQAEEQLTPRQQAASRRPSCIDNVVSVSIVPKSVRVKRAAAAAQRGDLSSSPAAPSNNSRTSGGCSTLSEEALDVEPPTILETDYDLEKVEMENVRVRSSSSQHVNLKSTPTYV